MGEDLVLLMVRAEEADDVALAGAAIEVVVASRMTSSGPSITPRPMISTLRSLSFSAIGRAGIGLGTRRRRAA